MPGELRNLPRAEVGENGFGQISALGLQAVDFLVDVDLGVGVHVAQFLDLRLQVGDRLFEIEKIQVHGLGPRRTRKT
jgi:hypothetical protein